VTDYFAMKDPEARHILRLPLSVLWEFPAITLKLKQESPMLAADFTKWLAAYSPEVQQLLAQLEWALAHPAYDFQSILKNVRTSNADILTFFAFLHPLLVQVIK
jgi:hypothetical protein